MTLPGPLRIGDRVSFRFALRRVLQGRLERLEVTGEWRVSAAVTSVDGYRVEVEPLGPDPSWKAVKKERPFVRQLSSPLSPRTVLT